MKESQSVSQWVTKATINCCKKKKDLQLLTGSTNDEKLKNYYLKYSHILSNTIKAAKKTTL
jgi:hypothetical protein